MVLFSGIVIHDTVRYEVVVEVMRRGEDHYRVMVNGKPAELKWNGSSWKSDTLLAPIASRIGAYLPDVPQLVMA